MLTPHGAHVPIKIYCWSTLQDGPLESLKMELCPRKWVTGVKQPYLLEVISPHV